MPLFYGLIRLDCHSPVLRMCSSREWGLHERSSVSTRSGVKRSSPNVAGGRSVAGCKNDGGAESGSPAVGQVNDCRDSSVRSCHVRSKACADSSSSHSFMWRMVPSSRICTRASTKYQHSSAHGLIVSCAIFSVRVSAVNIRQLSLRKKRKVSVLFAGRPSSRIVATWTNLENGR